MELNAIKEMERAARDDTAVVSLSQGIPFRESDKRIREYVIKAIQSGKVDSYSDPQGLLELRQNITHRLAEEGMDYLPREICVTVGAIEALSVTLRSVIREGCNEVIVPTPVYAAYFKAIDAARGQTIPIRLHEESGWRLDVNELRAAITPATCAILVCNPNNPTGNIYDRSTMRALAELAQEHDLTLITDEVYKNMIYEDAQWYTPAMEAQFHDTVVRIVSFSKDFSLTGWRVGFMHASQERMSELVAIHDTLVNCAPVVSQYAAIAALQYQDDILRDNLGVYEQNRRTTMKSLDMMGERVSYIAPEGAYFVFAKINDQRSSLEFCRDLLSEQKVALVHGSAFGSGGEDHVRICFGRSPDAVSEGMKRLKTFLSKNGKI